MPLHFAAARTANCSAIARALTRPAINGAANDNGDNARVNGTNEQLLHAALRHFGQHGLGAARQARSQAEAAFFAGDRQGYDWWLGICRTLDKRIAQQLDAETISQTGRADA